MPSKRCEKFIDRPNELCCECGLPRPETRYACPHCGQNAASAPTPEEIRYRISVLQARWPWWRLEGYQMQMDIPTYEIPTASAVTDHLRRKDCGRVAR